MFTFSRQWSVNFYYKRTFCEAPDTWLAGKPSWGGEHSCSTMAELDFLKDTKRSLLCNIIHKNARCSTINSQDMARGQALPVFTHSQLGPEHVNSTWMFVSQKCHFVVKRKQETPPFRSYVLFPSTNVGMWLRRGFFFSFSNWTSTSKKTNSF